MGKYYDGTKLLSMLDINGNKPEIYMCTTNRTGGKTTYFGRLCINRFLDKGEKFGLIYRYNYELDDVVDKFYKDLGSLFWTFFSFSLVTLLISYIPLFPAFLKLRKEDKTERMYKVPGGKLVINLMTYVPLVLLILGIVFTLFGDFSAEYISDNLPVIIGVVISLVVQEILAARVKNEEKK